MVLLNPTWNEGVHVHDGTWILILRKLLAAYKLFSFYILMNSDDPAEMFHKF